MQQWEGAPMGCVVWGGTVACPGAAYGVCSPCWYSPWGVWPPATSKLGSHGLIQLPLTSLAGFPLTVIRVEMEPKI